MIGLGIILLIWDTSSKSPSCKRRHGLAGHRCGPVGSRFRRSPGWRQALLVLTLRLPSSEIHLRKFHSTIETGVIMIVLGIVLIVIGYSFQASASCTRSAEYSWSSA